MAQTPPRPLDDLLGRKFSFYPPIHGIEHNEWLLKETGWSEVLIVNTQTNEELWAPRRYFGEVAETDEPVMIVGLNKELEFRAGGVWPVEKRVLRMAAAGGGPRREGPGPGAPEPAGGMLGLGGAGGGTESRIARLIGYSFLMILGLAVAAGLLYKFGLPRPAPIFSAKDQDYLGLGREDDYFAVVRRLGTPSGDRFKPQAEELQYRALEYKERGYIVLLMGTDQQSARYIGTLSQDWKPLHSIEFAGGSSTAPMLRNLKRF